MPVYTVLGDTVNTAARLKGAARQFGVSTLMLEVTQQLLEGRMATRELGLIQVVGKNETLRVFELLGRAGGLSSELEQLEQHQSSGLRAFRQGDWSNARAAFERCLEVRPDDVSARRYLDRLAELEGKNLRRDWDGAWRLTKK